MIKTLTIEGLRGFSAKQEIKFSIPDGSNVGSGLNIIVGPNNTGKSTIVEAINAFNGQCSFSEGKRNTNSKSGVILELVDENNNNYEISTIKDGGSEADRLINGKSNSVILNNYILPSRRFVEYEFGGYKGDKKDYIRQNLFGNRKASLNSFSSRLFNMQKNKDKLNGLLSFVVGANVNWTIEQNDHGQYYVKFIFGDCSHSSEGIGDGLWSILTICDALFDSQPQQTIVIDEPELSIHPLYQKRIMQLLIKYSKDRQIVICTHSPYFVDWESISKGASLIRTNKIDNKIQIHQVSNDFRTNVKGFLNDINHPHVLGLEANEVFFVDDGIVITEGQEDVVAINRINHQLGIELNGHLFGWGAGGASKEQILLRLFSDLGFNRVVCIFDGDKKSDFERCKEYYPEYSYFILPTDDIRDKKNDGIISKIGICTSGMVIKDEYKEYYMKLIDEINRIMTSVTKVE